VADGYTSRKPLVVKKHDLGSLFRCELGRIRRPYRRRLYSGGYRDRLSARNRPKTAGEPRSIISPIPSVRKLEGADDPWGPLLSELLLSDSAT
jgi:hypothetical protein